MLRLTTLISTMLFVSSAFAEFIPFPYSIKCREVAERVPEKDGYFRDMKFGNYEGHIGNIMEFGFSLTTKDGVKANMAALVITDLDCNVLDVKYRDLNSDQNFE